MVAVSTTKSAVVLKFSPVENATRYFAEYSTDASFANSTTKSWASAGVRTISGLAAGTTYYFRFQATADGFNDSQVVSLTATTKPEAPSAILDLDAAFENYFDDDLDVL